MRKPAPISKGPNPSRDVVLIRRTYEPRQVLSSFQVFEDERMIWQCKAMEPPWLNNKRNVSCVPPGRYTMIWEFSPRFQRHLFELKEVPGRSQILIHPFNFFWDTRGCIGLGDMFLDMNKDGSRDLRNSRKSLERFHKVMEGIRISSITIVG